VSFKVTTFGTDQSKAVCDFLLLNNSTGNLHPILHRFQDITDGSDF